MNINNIISQVLTNSNSAFFYTPPVYPGAYSYLFVNPSEIINADNLSEIDDSLKLINECIRKKMWGYGLINFETGYAFEPKLKKYIKNDTNFLQFFFFEEDEIEIIKSSSIIFDELKRNFSIDSFCLNTSNENYINNIGKIKSRISEGDTYQVNYTVKGKFKFTGNITDFFKIISFNQSAKYTAFINSDSEIIMSFSPELFFRIKGKKIVTKPMKGTIKRGYNSYSDSINQYNLIHNEKEKAENLMIVDLLRNDLGRLSKYEKVSVKNPFEVEKYETLFQMVSTVQAEMKKSILFSDIIKNIFPSGSVTGAPKISTMEIIKELETEKRGIYTGSIGIIKPDESIFNIAIRTAVINKEKQTGEIGLGSGVVWDSNAEKEYEEILLKSNFITNSRNYFELFETMRVENGLIKFFDDHLERLKNGADYFLFSFNEKKTGKYVEKKLEKLSHDKIYRFKLLLNKWGKINSEIKEYADNNNEKIKIIISDKRINSKNPFQFFKTTNRNLYNDELNFYKKKGYFDVIFLNENNHITEGAITNIFIKKDGNLLTPPVDSGILNGIYRRNILKNNFYAKEQFLYKDDLLSSDEIIITNSLRGELKVDFLYLNEKEFKEFF